MRSGSEKRDGGFTLVELMITLVIASILLAVTVPGLATLVDNNRIQTGAQSLFSALMLTRTEALKRNREVIMCKSDDGLDCDTGTGTNWEQGWLVYVDTDGGSDVDANEILSVQGAFNGGLTLRVTGSDFTNLVSYGTDGSASGTGTFILCNEKGDTDNAREVQISLTGRPRMNLTTTDCTP